MVFMTYLDIQSFINPGIGSQIFIIDRVSDSNNKELDSECVFYLLCHGNIHTYR